MSSEPGTSEDSAAAEAAVPQAQAPGIKKRNIAIIVLVLAGLWVAAITSGSLVGMIIVGVLTLAAAGIAFWVWRLFRRQRRLVDILQGAGASPEARRQALAALSAGKDSGDAANVLARAQLLAAEDPAAALALLEPVQLKGFPAAMQDDLALLKAQLLLSFGRAKEARPLADWINVDSAQRAQIRPIMVAVVAETWARTGAPSKADELLDTVKDSEVEGDVRVQLLLARAFARFASGNKGKARSALRTLASMDPNYLGRFLSPQARVHPGLQRLAREEAERSGALRGGRPHVAAGRRGRPR